VVYYLSEMGIESDLDFSWQSLHVYMVSPGHRFIFAAALLLGLLLGIAEAQADRYARLLQRAARQLKQYADWGFGARLIGEAFQNPYKLALKRVPRTVLFMDIRGFTSWTEQQSPDTVAEMLERCYRTAEEAIVRFGGQPPSYLGDGVLTRFDDPNAAVQAARDLVPGVNAALQPWGLMVGIGLHTGEVMEGLLGGKETRRFDAIGDPVNTASRLSGVAGPGEIILSSDLFRQLHPVPPVSESRSVTVKGKREPLTVYVL
jgi:class 3 adenylate cyclase